MEPVSTNTGSAAWNYYRRLLILQLLVSNPEMYPGRRSGNGTTTILYHNTRAQGGGVIINSKKIK